MFYSKLRRKASSDYEAALMAIRETNDRKTNIISKFTKVQTDSINVIRDICDVLNTIANTPIEIKSDTDRALTGLTGAYKINLHVTEISESFQRANGELLKSLGNVMIDCNTGSKTKAVVAGVYTLNFAILHTIKNKKIADLIHEKTKEIYAEIKNVEIFTNNVEKRTLQINKILAYLVEKKDFVDSFRNVDYIEIDMEQRYFLGNIVNTLLSLSKLISDKI